MMLRAAVVGMLSCMSACLTAAAADTNATPAAWLGDTSEADSSGLISFSSTGPGSITVTFAAQGGPPAYAPATVIADAGDPDSPFSGDYVAAGAQSMSFRIMSDGHVPRCPAVVIVGRQSGRMWYNTGVTVSSVAGEWTVNNVALELAAGWTTEASGNLDAMWDYDLKDVGMTGVRLVQYGLEAQSYTIDEFRLSGANGFITPPAGLSPLELALQERFGVTSLNDLSDEQRRVDSNQDGMTDLTAILSETDASYANSIFAAEVVPNSQAEGVTIKWPCVAASTYTVLRSQDLTGDFLGIEDPQSRDRLATWTGYMTYVDTSATGAGPYFYKILKR